MKRTLSHVISLLTIAALCTGCAIMTDEEREAREYK